MPVRTRTSHAPSKIRMVSSPGALNLVVRIVSYRVTDGRVNVRSGLKKRRRLARRNLVARPGEINRYGLMDAARRPAQHHDAIAEIDRLFNVVRDEDEARAGAGVNFQ